jgi:prepilin-type N-terminal cleavage/methylation domain-containing protein
MSTTHTQRGFTLIEVILSLSVAAGVAIAVFSTFQLIQTVHARQQAAGIVAWESELIINRIRTLAAKGIVIPAPQESSVSLSVEDDETLALRDGVLFLSGNGSDEPFSSTAVRVSSLSFQNLGTPEVPGMLRVRYTVSTLSSVSAEVFELSVDTSMYE